MSYLFLLSYALTVFAFGLGARSRDVLGLFRDTRLLAVSLLAMFVVMPVAAVALGVYLELSTTVRVALLAVAFSPVPQLLPRTAISSGGRDDYAYGLSFVLALFSPGVILASVHFLGELSGERYAIPGGVLAAVLWGSVLLPLGLGWLAQRLVPRAAARMLERSARLGDALLLVALVSLLVGMLPTLLKLATWSTVTAVAAFVLVGFGVGHAMAGPEPDRSIVLAVACSIRNPAIAIGLGAANFRSESFAATVILYALVAGVVAIPYQRWGRRRYGRGAVRSVDDVRREVVA